MTCKMPVRSFSVPSHSSYAEDFLAWSEHTVRLLRARRFEEVDLENLIEEIESMGKSQQRELDSRLRVLLRHLLKWKYQPERRSTSWALTLDNQRFELDRLLRQSPSLRPVLTHSLADVYPAAVRTAALETRLPRDTFPARCPFTARQILDPDFLPE